MLTRTLVYAYVVVFAVGLLLEHPAPLAISP